MPQPVEVVELDGAEQASREVVDALAEAPYAGPPELAVTVRESRVDQLTPIAPHAHDVALAVPPRLRALVERHVVDAELAALVWLLVEARVPIVVAGAGDRSMRAAVLEALLDTLPAGVRRIPLAGATEDFAWLPDASALGWHDDGPTPGRDPAAIEPAERETAVIVAPELASRDPDGTWDGATRLIVRACSLGYGLAATIEAGSLDAVLARLRTTRLTDDELSRLGVVLVLAEVDGHTRVVAAHYVRPIARDVHGHIQRLGPAVLATFDADAGRFEHFGWGVTPELAMRTGHRAGDFEIEHARRRDAIDEAGMARA